jgi:hypothetical protein
MRCMRPVDGSRRLVSEWATGMREPGKRRTIISFAIDVRRRRVICDGGKRLVGQSLSLRKSAAWRLVFGQRLAGKLRLGRCRQAMAFWPEDKDRLLRSVVRRVGVDGQCVPAGART